MAIVSSSYRLIGIDLDGTLLDEQGRISAANRQAIARAQHHGVGVIPCTGRGWREARKVLGDVPGLGLGVFTTGAVVAEIDTGRSHDFAVIEPHLAYELITFLRDEPEAVLAFREHNLAGHEYLVTGRGKLTASTQSWFNVTGAKVRHQARVTAEDLHHTLRVGMVPSAGRAPELTRTLGERFGDRVRVQCFAALKRDDDDSIYILEIFAAGVDKWRGLRWIAQRQGIDAEQIATIGDQINDLPMLRAAGCGIAMGNAVDDAKRHADHITHAHDRDGVAHAIDQLLCGRWI